MSKFFYNISLPLAVQGTFTYSSDIRLEIGFRVLVDFSNRERIGVVIKNVDKPAFKTLKIKKVFEWHSQFFCSSKLCDNDPI